jgi:hypothetical protein
MVHDSEDSQPRDVYLHRVARKRLAPGAEDGRDEPGSADDVSGRARKDSPSTGEPRVDEALTLLDDLAELPVHDHAAVFEQVHSQLSEVLGELDPGPGDTGQAER